MAFTLTEERQIRGVLALHLQRMKTHVLSFAMDGKTDTAEKQAAHDIEANKCRQVIDQIIAEESL